MRSLPSHLAIYAAHLGRLVARWGVTEDALLEGSGLTHDDLTNLEGRIPESAMVRLLTNALALTGEPGLGFYQGLQLKLSAHGSVGLAAMTSATIEDALAVTVRFFPLRAQRARLVQTFEGDDVVIELVDTLEEGQLRAFVLESLLTGLVQMSKTIYGAPLITCIDVKLPEPDHFQGFAHLWPAAVRFDRTATRLVFPKDRLRAPAALADALTSERAIAECERELALLGETSSVLAGVRKQMMSQAVGFPSATELAQKRRVSTRTLKRQLAAHGTSFQQILDELKRDRAMAMLEHTDHSIEHIGELLGYADPSNFHRAFRRWTGASPSHFRPTKR